MILNNVEKQELTRYAEAYDFSSCIKNCSVLVTGSSGMIGTGISAECGNRHNQMAFIY